VLSRERAPQARRVEWRTMRSLTEPGERDALRFEQRNGMLRNILTRPVPRLAAEHAERVLRETLAEQKVARERIAAWIWHAGGRDVLQALQSRIGLADADVAFSAGVLREYGNLSSPFVYFVLEAALAARARSGLWWVSSFGAGFSCHGALLDVG
jgi:alkylresorcinol/alkylpyrone synthase